VAEPASWLLIEFLAEVVGQITVDNGYYSNLGSSPIVIDDQQLDPDQAGTVIESGDIEVTSVTASQVNYDMDVMVEFGVPRGDGQENVKHLVHRAALDLARALMLKSRTLPRFVREFKQTGARVLSGEDATGAAFVIAQVTARASLTDLKLPEPL
jgi:hypothetical protein